MISLDEFGHLQIQAGMHAETISRTLSLWKSKFMNLLLFSPNCLRGEPFYLRLKIDQILAIHKPLRNSKN